MLQEVERAQPGGSQPPVPPNYTRLKQKLAGFHSTISFPRSDPGAALWHRLGDLQPPAPA